MLMRMQLHLNFHTSPNFAIQYRNIPKMCIFAYCICVFLVFSLNNEASYMRNSCIILAFRKKYENTFLQLSFLSHLLLAFVLFLK